MTADERFQALDFRIQHISNTEIIYKDRFDEIKITFFLRNKVSRIETTVNNPKIRPQYYQLLLAIIKQKEKELNFS